jgi:2-polyprenyl-3-methyl-5-hydroxy-6-metoxy-1,4-benzoquinol methylase
MNQVQNKTNHNLKIHQDIPTIKWNNDTIKKFWDYQSRFPDQYFTNQFGKEIVNLLLDFLPHNSRVLDYACGTGSLTKYLLDAGFIVTSCDLSPTSIEIVNNNYKTHPNFLGAHIVEEIINSNIQFDAVILVELIEHIDDSSLTTILSNVHDLLKSKGLAIFSTPNDENLTSDTVYCPSCNHTFHKWQHVRSWNSFSLNLLFINNNFFTVSIRQMNFYLNKNNGYFRYYLSKIRNLFKLNKYFPHLVGVARKN